MDINNTYNEKKDLTRSQKQQKPYLDLWQWRDKRTNTISSGEIGIEWNNKPNFTYYVLWETRISQCWEMGYCSWWGKWWPLWFQNTLIQPQHICIANNSSKNEYACKSNGGLHPEPILSEPFAKFKFQQKKNSVKISLLWLATHQMLIQIPNSGLFTLHRTQCAYKHTKFTLFYSCLCLASRKTKLFPATGQSKQWKNEFGFRYFGYWI